MFPLSSSRDPTAATLQRSPPSLSRVCGVRSACATRHFGDRQAAQSHAGGFAADDDLTVIGLLPGATIGIFAPLLLALARFGQGTGGEWGGAALLATEYRAAAQRALYG